MWTGSALPAVLQETLAVHMEARSEGGPSLLFESPWKQPSASVAGIRCRNQADTPGVREVSRWT